MENKSANAQDSLDSLVFEGLVVKHICHLMKLIGDDPHREGLKQTPYRVAKSWSYLFSGYGKDVKDVFKTFDGEKCKEMVVIKDIEFYSTCEHHLLPFFGKAHVGYIPKKRVIGASKIPRIVEIYSRRLQIQERLAANIADALWDNLKPKGVMVVLEAQHLCMMARGVEKQNSVMMTSAIRGEFEKSEVRQEFLSLIGVVK